MSKITIVFVVLCVFLQRGSSLECYTCATACAVQDALSNSPCGNHAPPALDAFCTTEYPESDTPGKKPDTVRVRKCVLALKGSQPDCPRGQKCTFCATDRCNDNSDVTMDKKNGEDINTAAVNARNVTSVTDASVRNNKNVTATNVATKSAAGSIFLNYFNFASMILSYIFIKCVLYY